MSFTNVGSVNISGSVFTGNNLIIYNAPGQQPAPFISTNDGGSNGTREAHSSSPIPPTFRRTPSMADAELPYAGSSEFAPRVPSFENDHHPAQTTSNFPIYRWDSLAIPLSPLSSSLDLQGLSSDWPMHEAKSLSTVLLFEAPLREDSVIPFQPIGNPLQHQRVSPQLGFFQYDSLPVLRARTHTPAPEPNILPRVWVENHPQFEGWGTMPAPQYHNVAQTGTPWPVDDRDIDNAGGVEMYYPDQIYDD